MNRVVVILLVPAFVTLFMLITGLGPAWPPDLFTRIWFFSALGMLLVGSGFFIFHQHVLVRRILMGVFVATLLLYIAFTILSVNRIAGLSKDKQDMDNAVNNIYRQQDARPQGQR